MDSYKLSVKFFVQNASQVKVEDFIPVFHRWIQSRALEGHQLIDVADYGHVQDGPGVVLVAHEANIHADMEGGRVGLLYIRKQPIEGSFGERLATVFKFTLQAARMLEEDRALNGLKFGADEAIFRVYDRLHAPNTPETFRQVKGDLQSFLGKLYSAQPIDLSYRPDAQRLFEVGIRGPKSIKLSELLNKIASA
jgi:hypothetical protein